MTSFPYVAMDVVNDQNPPRPPVFLVMHWHEDFQFIVVLAGSVILHTLNRTTIVHAGEGVFINRRVVHLVLGTSGCHYQTFVFPERFVTFYPGSPAEQYSSSLSENEELPTFVFSQKRLGVNRFSSCWRRSRRWSNGRPRLTRMRCWFCSPVFG